MRYESSTKRWINATVIEQVPGVRTVTSTSSGGLSGLVDGGAAAGGQTTVLDGGAAAGGQVGFVDGGAP